MAKGNSVVYKVGKDAIMNLSGKSMPQGAFRAMAEAAKQVDVSTIKRLKANTGPVTINRAMFQFFNNYDEILKKTGLLESFKEDTTMLAGGRTFAGVLMFGSFSHSKLRDIQAALSSESAAELDTLFKAGGRDWFSRELDDETINEAIMGDPEKDVPENVTNEIRNNMDRMSTVGFGLLHNITSLLLGEEPKEVPDLNDTSIPENTKMILEDYAKDTKIKFGMAE